MCVQDGADRYMDDLIHFKHLRTVENNIVWIFVHARSLTWLTETFNIIQPLNKLLVTCAFFLQFKMSAVKRVYCTVVLYL